MRILFASAVTALTTACATGSTFRSGVGDTFLAHPPYYAGAAVVRDTARIATFPVAYQRGGSQAPMFDPAGGSGTPIAALVAEMNAYLDSLGVGPRVAGSAVSAGTPPDVRFGCETDASGDCVARGDSVLGRGNQTMRLAVGRPSDAWTAWAGSILQGAGASRALLVTVEIGRYLPRQRGWRGDKEVELGTANTVNLPWLTSLETPVSVIQLTGALVGSDGKATRIGAEGVLARRTRFSISALGAQELITDEDVERVRTLRRDDLPGQPLAWQVALRHLVAQLTGRSEIASR